MCTMGILYKLNKDQKGAFLIEIIISLGLVGFIMVVVMQLVIQNLQVARLNEARIVGTNYAHRVLLLGRHDFIDPGIYNWDGTCKGFASCTQTYTFTWEPSGSTGIPVIFTGVFTINNVIPVIQAQSNSCEGQDTAKVTWNLYNQTNFSTVSEIISRNACQ